MFVLLPALMLLAAACQDAPIESLEEIITTPTPQPTSTPGPIEDAVSDISSATGLDQQVILGLSGEDWINLGISLVVVLLGVFVVTRLIFAILRFIARATPGDWDDKFVTQIQFQVRLFFGVWIVDYATRRLIFLPLEWHENLNQLYFVLYILAIAGALWKLIDVALARYKEGAAAKDEAEQQETLIVFIRRILRGVLVVLAVTIVLYNYGVNVTVILAALGIAAVAIAIAAQDTLTDMIYGFIILLDRPYRIGDRIGIHELDTWGDVAHIGTRTTRVRTRDNRLVIFPNTIMGKSQVVNYTYPDPHYRVQTEIDIAYGYELGKVRGVIIDAVRESEGVLADKPVDTLLEDLGKSGLRFRVRWWIDSYTDTSYVYDRVHSVLYEALAKAGIEMSLDAYDLNLLVRSSDSPPTAAPTIRPAG
jgi:small-conductance mechanosensitive channel